MLGTNFGSLLYGDVPVMYEGICTSKLNVKHRPASEVWLTSDRFRVIMKTCVTRTDVV